MSLEKAKFFSEEYDKTLQERDELRGQFLDLLKTVPVLIAIAIFFLNQTTASYTIETYYVDTYNRVLTICLMLTFAYATLVITGFFFPPKYKKPLSPKEKSNYWDTIEKHAEEYELEIDPLDHFVASQLKQKIDDAEINYQINRKRNRKKILAGIILIVSCLTYIFLIIVILART